MKLPVASHLQRNSLKLVFLNILVYLPVKIRHYAEDLFLNHGYSTDDTCRKVPSVFFLRRAGSFLMSKGLN